MIHVKSFSHTDGIFYLLDCDCGFRTGGAVPTVMDIDTAIEHHKGQCQDT